MNSFEVNFDGVVGPTHNYAGLAFGNVASNAHGGSTSSPRQAALQGLEKMMSLRRLGLRQAVLPPHERPHLPTLRRLGFNGNSEAQLLEKVANQAPTLLASVTSASSMWVANAATISPFADTEDGNTHITPANLNSMFHRSIEVEITSAVLQAIFQGEGYCHHPALPAGPLFSDEGAANHTRFCSDYGGPGVELFVYGASVEKPAVRPAKYPARQTLEASQAIARNHGLSAHRTVMVQQNPAVIDAGVFHNDVIAVGNRQLMFYHEKAFLNTADVRSRLDTAIGGEGLDYIEVAEADISLQEAVASYLFNSQLITQPGHAGSTIIVPAECEATPRVKNYLDRLQSDHAAIEQVIYFDLKQSMHNGGGPACLRLRVVMTDAQIAATRARVFLDDELYSELKHWIENHYRDSLAPEDLKDPALLIESRTALDSLTGLLKLGSIYEFQK
ncbi:MAG: N-succinylarginine dihydrolase [Proteobacteria bacterium]|nr:N-succinylarginine dihydrolase [Pseudomonadota bacterium]